MRLDTGPVCITDQTEPKTTPSPIPRDASRIRDRRTQLAPAVAGGGRRGDGVRFKGVVVASRLGACVVRASAPRRSNVQAGGIAEPQHFGSACVRAASAPQNEQQMQAGAIGAFLAAARRRTPVFFCALVRRLRNVLGMTNRPSLQRETTANRSRNAGRNPFFPPPEATKPDLRVLLGL